MRLCLLALPLLAAACAPSGPIQNVLTLRSLEARGLWPPTPVPLLPGEQGVVVGQLLALDAGGERPAAGATVVLAGPTGLPYTAVAGPDGYYRIEGVPPGVYLPAAVGPGLEETIATASFGIPWPIEVGRGATVTAPSMRLLPHRAPALPDPGNSATRAALQVEQVGATRVVTSPFPAGAVAQRSDWRFVREGIAFDTLRLYLPVPAAAQAAQLEPATPLPLFVLVYPSHVDGWESVSVAFAAQGFAVLALSPVEAHGADLSAHAQDARLALRLAQAGALESGPSRIDDETFAVLGGSYSSAIVHRLLRNLDADAELSGAALPAAWVSVGGIANAFSGTADYWAGKLDIPEWHADAIPALGMPGLQPLAFLRYSPVFTAAQMPPTLLIHTAADRVVPISQAQQLAAALEAAGVPVEFYTYSDTSHYLQVGAETTAAGKAMFERILAFLHARLRAEELP